MARISHHDFQRSLLQCYITNFDRDVKRSEWVSLFPWVVDAGFSLRSLGTQPEGCGYRVSGDGSSKLGTVIISGYG
jgi:hypothetical protein